MVEAAWQWTQRLFEKVPARVVYAFAGLGAWLLFRSISVPFCAWWSFRLRGVPDYARIYGKGAYVIITGASDGIGEELAYRFAAMGFNLVLVARNEDKLNHVKERCVIAHRVKVVSVIEDLATMEVEVFQRIADAVRDLDVAILVNNAGFLTYYPLACQSPADVTSQITVNCVSHTLLTRLLLPKLLSRPRKCLIINIASISGTIPAGYLCVYSATKAYMRFFSLALRQEVQGKIDVFSANPGRVRTKMVVAAEKLEDVTELDTTVTGILKEAPRKGESFCSLKHALIHHRFSSMPLQQVTALWSIGTKMQFQVSSKSI